MAGVNKVILVGNLGEDPKVRTLENGATVANFSLATTESYKDKSGNRVEQTEWHNIVLWRSLGEIAAKYLKKGMTIYVEGKIRTRSWEDKDGVKKYMTEIIGETMTMLSKKNDHPQNTGHDSSNVNEQNSAGSYQSQNPSSAPINSPGPALADEDLPF